MLSQDAAYASSQRHDQPCLLTHKSPRDFSYSSIGSTESNNESAE